MTFTFVQGSSSITTSTALTGVASGNILIVAVQTYGGLGATCSVSDGGNNFYPVTPNSPADDTTVDHRKVWLFYVLNAVGGNLTVTVTTNEVFFGLWFDEFSHSSGSVAFEKDAAAGNSVTSAPVNTPSINPTNAGSLLYAMAFPSTAQETSVGSPWTTGTFLAATNTWAAYILSSSSGSTAVNFPAGADVGWAAMAMAITPTGNVVDTLRFPKFLLRNPPTGATSV